MVKKEKSKYDKAFHLIFLTSLLFIIEFTISLFYLRIGGALFDLAIILIQTSFLFASMIYIYETINGDFFRALILPFVSAGIIVVLGLAFSPNYIIILQSLSNFFATKPAINRIDFLTGLSIFLSIAALVSWVVFLVFIVIERKRR